MPAAGQIIQVGRIPSELIASTENVTDSANFTTTETEVLSVTARLVDGRVYRVRGNPGFASDAAGDVVTARLRQDTSTGTAMDSDTVTVAIVSSLRKRVAHVDARFTATATGDKTFVVTGQREGGSGTIKLEGETSRPSFLDVYYESG